ncbi:MAG: hypothetical protein QM831_02180 [Kofleriaceae bacterium]
MAKFVLGDGETVLASERITVIDRYRPAHKADLGKLIVTDRRVVIVSEKRSPLWNWLFGFRGATRAIAINPKTLTHEIKRREFGNADTAGPNHLEVRTKGTGYEMNKFEVEISNGPDWVHQLRIWGGVMPELGTAFVDRNWLN